MSESRIRVRKVTSLLTLTMVSAINGITNEYSRSRVGPIFVTSSVVLMSEIVKLLFSILFVLKENNFSVKKSSATLQNTMVNKIESLKMGVLSVLYVVQNNLYYLSVMNLESATFQVINQSKILSMAIFAVVIFKKSLFPKQWFALVVLVVGVALVRMSGVETKKVEENKFLGFLAAFCNCLISGFTGNFLEKIIQSSNVSLWERNVQLAFYSIPSSFAAAYFYQWEQITANGWFCGYDAFVCFLVVLNAGSGLIVSIVVKFAGNILKVFATSLGIVITCFSSIYFFNFQLNFIFVLGTVLVVTASFLYSQKPSSNKELQ